MSSESSTSGNPAHIAIIMDGNNRWAKARGVPGPVGHKAGVERVRDVMRACREAGATTLTVFAFSSENWQRPKAEVAALMSLFSVYLRKEARELSEEGVRLRVIGSQEKFSEKLRKEIAKAEELTRNGTMTLVIAADYGGRWDIVQAAKALAVKAAAGQLDPASIDEALFDQHTALAGLPPLDLLIRTGGELRISNFLLWQAAYAELYYTDVLWPDFDRAQLQLALTSFRGRERRFGLSHEQVVGGVPHA